jgi:putative tricarboxylic transport membrane protein
MVVSMLGAYVVAFNWMLTVQALLFGILGYALIRFGFSVVPFILGLILGPLAELNLNRTYQIAGDQNVLWFILQRPLSAVMAVMVVLLLLSEPLRGKIKIGRLLRRGAGKEMVVRGGGGRSRQG